MFLKRLGGAAGARSDVADDLCQRTWMMAWEAIQARKYDAGRAAISTFVYAVGNIVWLRHMRAAGRAAQNGHATDLADLERVLGAPGDADAGVAMSAAEEIDAVRAALAERGVPGALLDEERMILSGSARGESDRALAARLGLAPSTVNVKKNGAMQKLRDALLRRGHGPVEQRGTSAPSQGAPR